MGGKKGGSDKYPVTDYYMSIHYGICHGPVDMLLGIWVKERDAWPGTTVYETDGDVQENTGGVGIIRFLAEAWAEAFGWEREESDASDEFIEGSVLTDPTGFSINKPDLFGGDQKEGGLDGYAYYMPGRSDQVLPAYLAEKLELTPETAPAYRGIASVFFTGHTDERGFMWCQNNPYLPSAWFTVARKPLGLTTTESMIQTGDNMPDANPAHIIYECLTNKDWGMGSPSTAIDVASFEAAGSVLVAEEFGLSMIWSQQATIEAFIGEVLDHIQATLFVNPRTGLLTLKLIRGDYDIETLREFNPDNCDATNRQRKAWAETINEIVVTWTNPVNEQEETVVYQDLANIAMQGETVSDPREYYGVRNADLAARLAVRDLRSASYPLFSCNIEVDRTAWDLLPGEVCLFSWPEDGIEQIVMRVGTIDYGKPGSMSIKANLVEDVFSLEQAEYTAPAVTGWTDPTQEPVPFAHTEFLTTPLPMLIAAGVDSLTVDDNYPDVGVVVFAQQTGNDTHNFVLNGPYTLPNGDLEFGNLATMLQTSRSETAGTLLDEAVTYADQVTLGSIDGSERPEVGGFIMLGEGGDLGMEMVMLDAFDENTGLWTLARGIYDTVPRSWPAGTPVWYIHNTSYIVDPKTRVAGQEVEYRLQPRTSKGLLPFAAAPVETANLTERPYLPFRPTNCEIDGMGFGSKTYTGTTRPVTIPVSWSNRNRLMEDQVARRWDEGNVTPEEGQTTTIRCFEQGTNNMIAEFTGIVGNSFDIPYNQMQGYRYVDVQFLAERDGFESLQGARRAVIFDLDGYGNDYGNNYGG